MRTAREELTAADALLARIADVMRRCDPEYTASHSAAPTSDDEWDDCLAEVEEFVEDIGEIGVENAL